MFKSLISLIIIFLTTCFILTCENTTESREKDNSFKGITETDENGNLIGNFDFDDWTLPNRYFGNKIETKPYTSFEAAYIGQEVSRYIKIINHYNKNYTLKFKNLNPPFIINKTTITFAPNQTDSLLIKFVLPDTSDYSYKDSLEITNEFNEQIKFYLSGYWYNPNPNDSTSVIEKKEVYNNSYSFYPAYPNPTTESITLRYSNISSTYPVNLKIIDKQKNIVKILVNNKLQNIGSYQVAWDLKDNNGNKVTPSIFRVELDINDFHSHGDIKIE